MFESKEARLVKASIDVLYGILKKSKMFEAVKGGNNEEKYELDNCYVGFNAYTNKIVMTSKGEPEQKTTIDCHVDSNDDMSEIKRSGFHKLLMLARDKSAKYYERTAKENLNAVHKAIKQSTTVKRVDPDTYNARYELDTCIVYFDSSKDYTITVIQKNKEQTTTQIKWNDMKKVSWKKFYKLLDLVKKKYEKEQKRLAGQKVSKQLEIMRQIQNGGQER